MGVLVYLICIAVASFAVLAQPAVAQGANTTLPLTYPGQVLQGDGSQTCPSEAQRGITRNEVNNATQRLLRESVVPLLQGYSCGGSIGWRRVAYLNMSDPSQQCPSVWQEITTPHRVCGRRSTSASCEGLTYSTGSEQYDQVCGRIIGYQLGSPYAFDGPTLSILMELVSHMALPASTSGVLLLVSMKGGTFLNQRAPVLLKALMTTLSLRLWARTTSVNQA